MSKPTASSGPDAASTDDIRTILGALDESDLLEIASLQPTIRDLEEAATWLSGDRDIFGTGEPLTGVASEIVEVLTASEDDSERAR